MPEESKLRSEQENEQGCQGEEYPIPLETKYSRKKALLEFRCLVEDAIIKHYLFGKEKESVNENENLRNLTLWGVPLLPSKGHEATDVVLIKFLKARDFKAYEAFNMLRKTLKWRREMEIDENLEENLGSGLGKVGFIKSKDKKGHPLWYVVYKACKKKKLYEERFGTEDKCEEFLRGNINSIEKCIQMIDFKPGGANSIIRIVDLKHAPAPAMKELVIFSKKIFSLFQEYYPGIIFRNVFINVPLWFLAFHALQLRLLPRRTKSKFIFVRPDRVTETLLKFIGPENLPVQYGGLKREDDQEFSCDGEILQQKVRANNMESIEIPVDQAGMTVFWDMTVVGYEVSYKEEFIPDDDCSYRVLVQKEEKMRKSVRNSFHVREPGKIVLSIKNATYKKKMAFYRYSIKPTFTDLTFD